MTQDVERKNEQESVAFSSHVVRVSIVAVIMIGTIAALVLASGSPISIGPPSPVPLAWLYPPLGERPVEGIEVTKPPWYFLWLLPLEENFGVKALMYAWTGLFIVLVLVPFIDREPHADPRRRKVMMTLMALILIMLITLTVYGAVRPTEKHVEETEGIIRLLTS